MFELKKIVSAFLMPLPALLIIGFLGLALIMFTSRRKFGCLVVLLSLTGILLISIQPISNRLLLPLERQYSAFLPVNEPIDYVMVLGHAHVVDSSIPPTSELSPTALTRLAEGIRILRMYPNAKLILSGYGRHSETSHARMMAKVALALGVSKPNIVLLETAKDTWEEARLATAYVQDSNLVLVTSASHMPRAMNEFTQAGLKPYPAPTNYIASKHLLNGWERYLPDSQYLAQTELYWHETLGSHWRELQDWAVDVSNLEFAEPEEPELNAVEVGSEDELETLEVNETETNEIEEVEIELNSDSSQP
ncbi:envelope biogenesis factor ElyC [Vibrio hippocampi]|uniref:DUF218 domain-containing protein n=1 Tax=Vibrio hippocampi TaxID=654686 RepID=A0ABN8DGF1_9VIBR|nr:envelope biogenesis factor ElyC [Vibrio hippocampi]CAH0525590.1 hypothetical protein VHP8226_01118 [Vibrio hippocampi]